MELILWRHADAGDPENDPEADFERRLSERGRRQAARVARWLQSRLPERCLVLSSPAPRARETAEALGRKVRIDERLSPGANGHHLLAVAGWPERNGSQVRHVVLVGHQPSLGEAVSLALAGIEQPWTVRKAMLVWLVARHEAERSTAYLKGAIGPDLV
jgi:phosphohistidine phosphatase